MKNSIFFKQAEILLRLIPFITKEKCFALKGGSAINFFVRDMPRLSVDIDLVYLPLENRETALANINSAVKRIKNKISKAIPKSKCLLRPNSKLLINFKGTEIRIEPNLIFRGAVYPCEKSTLTQKAKGLFQMSVDAKILSFEDLYSGKLCAALDRQHPRDFFDLMILMKNEGITDKIRKAFVVYLAGHNRPMNELLRPRWQDFRSIYENDFMGMPFEPVSYDELIKSRNQMHSALISTLTADEKSFLISIKERSPKWELMEIEGIDNLPAVQWKLKNITLMSKKKRIEALEKLKNVLNY